MARLKSDFCRCRKVYYRSLAFAASEARGHVGGISLQALRAQRFHDVEATLERRARKAAAGTPRPQPDANPSPAEGLSTRSLDVLAGRRGRVHIAQVHQVLLTSEAFARRDEFEGGLYQMLCVMHSQTEILPRLNADETVAAPPEGG